MQFSSSKNALRYLTLALTAGVAVQALPANASGFTGAYAIGTWTSSETYGGATFASVDATQSTLKLLEPNSYPSTPWASQEFDFSHVVGSAGTVSFDWSFDASVDACCSGFNFYKNGTLISNLTGGDFNSPYGNFSRLASGTFSEVVNAGDIITFGAFSADSCCGASVNTVSAFSAPGAVPEPASWAMMLVGMGAIGFAARRRQNVSVSYA